MQATLLVNPALHPSRVTKSSTSFNCLNVTSAGRQATLCDTILARESRSSEAGCELIYCARGRRLIVITADFPSSFKNSSFSIVLPSPDS